MFKHFFRRIATAFGLTALAVGAPAAAKAPQAHPALWEVSDPDTTIYLFGTIHLLPENYRWRTPKFDKALGRSQELIVETIVDEKDPTKMMAALVGLGFAKGLPPITERVAPDKREALKAAMAKTGFPPAAFDQMKTWTAAFMLLSNQFKDLGLKGAEGVEAVLRASFAASGKPVGELESNAEQLGFFNALPEDAQRALLESAVDRPEGMDKEFAAMLSAWARGDTAQIAKTFDGDMAAIPALQQNLIRKRNANWSKWIEQRMAKPGSVMLAVGAGHLAGKESVIAMLQRQGYRVRRLQ